jgi:uncharacterized membrane protein YdjX (TVP38/TMEM64 family)
MKEIKILAAVFFLWCIFIYAVFAFVKAEPNPFNWLESTRVFMVFITFFIYYLFAAVFLTEYKK